MDFDMLGLNPRLIAALNEQGITDPTPIQKKAIPLAMEGRDVMGLAQTGTGKTAAFGLPMIHALWKVGQKPAPKTVRGLILAPTRELANQIKDNLWAYTKGSHIKVGLIVGGVSINAQIKRLERGTDLLVATPGRLLDLIDRKAVDLSETRYLVLDEADQMLDLGFIHALRRIAPLLSADRQTMLFSATMPKHMEELSRAYLTDPVRVETAPPGKPADKVTQGVVFVRQPRKIDMLMERLRTHMDERSIVFARTKHGSERLMKALREEGFKADSVHGNKSQGQRERAIKALREGDVMVLVATDVAARGLDIPDVRVVYNYDLPNVPDNYVHRIGRTARAGRDGTATAFCAPDEMAYLRAIQKVMGKTIPTVGGEPWDAETEEEPQHNKRQPKRRGGSRGGHRGGAGTKPKSQAPKPARGGKPSKPKGSGRRRSNKRGRAA